jgi:PHD/YefM family antitoxin component YafN of YafNO toxin-antitoxin module
MQIVPMRDLKNTVEIERRCKEENGPVFVTKNGYGCLVVMNMEYFEKTMNMFYEAKVINEGIEDINKNNVQDGNKTISDIRKKYGV